MESETFKYIKRIGIALSVLFNVSLGGQSNQTFSARNYGWKREGRLNAVWVIDVVFKYIFRDGNNHCLNSWVYWFVRKNLTEGVTSNVIDHTKNTIKYEGLNQ